MKLVGKILMPVDVNRVCTEQINSVVKMSKEFNSEVSVLYVIPETELHSEIEELLRKYIKEALAKVVKALEKEKVSCSQPIIQSGNPVEKILQAANEQGSNLILVGSGNKSEDEIYKLGTIAEKLVELSEVPVWVAKTGQPTDLKEILCPIDFSDPARRALSNAILLAINFEAKLHVLSVFEPFSTTSPRFMIDPKVENEKLFGQFEQRMNDFLRDFDFKGVNHSIEIQKGIPHEKILESIQGKGIDFLVMGTNGRSGFSRLIMGSVTEKVIRQLPCSFVTTKTQFIFKLRLDSEIKEIETHFSDAEKLQKNGYYKEAIDQHLICLQINDMHVPSMYKLSKLFEITGDQVQADYYEKLAGDLLQRLWNKKIEFEIRKHYWANK